MPTHLFNQLAPNYTDTSAFNPADSGGAQVIRTATIPGNYFSFVRVRSLISVEQTGTSVAQTLTFVITIGAATKTITLKTYAALKFDLIPFEFMAPCRLDGGIAKIELNQAGTADAQTSIISKDFVIEGVD